MGKISDAIKPGKKKAAGLVIGIVIAVVSGAAVCIMDHQHSIEFNVLGEKDIPREISGDVIPEYRTMERALACLVDDKVYVLVMRGEKPASGYKVNITRMKMEEKDGRNTLIVYADFKDPDKDTSMSQLLNYPLKVAETDLGKLPDEIELRVRYIE